MSQSPMVRGSLSATNRVQLQFTIHVLVDCCFAQWDSFSLQKRPHLSVPHDPMGIMIKSFNPLTIMRFLSVITCFRISEVVVLSVWMNAQLLQKPSQSELLLILIKETICH